uniref:Glycosyl hydrolase family 88 n=1 Tax=Physcomitrium patens TaxID=3218 RepID=A0A2K1L8Q4_PHYPA|nr:hypothetical protein PHYPA_000808 [Physcomitrium patens]
MKMVGGEVIAKILATSRHHRIVLLKVFAFVALITVLFAATLAIAPAMEHVSGQQALDFAKQMGVTSMSLWNVTGPAKDRFQYELGVFLRGVELLSETTQDQKYLDFIKFKIDRFVTDNGTINTYKFNEFQLDSILTGRLLLTLFKSTGALKYKTAADILREQLRKQPRTNEGGFWHKDVYPYQMWLDGLYMAEPYYARYAKEFDDRSAFDDIAAQFIIMENRTRNETTGLLYHGYDEARVQAWADPLTGCSPSIWGRSVGWFAMGVLDTLEFFPVDHPKRSEMVAILNRIASAVKRFQDAQSGLWWQVMDKGGEAGNYLESSASAMFVYTLAKGIRLAYLSKDDYLDSALKGYDGIVAHFVDSGPDGGVNYLRTVSVGGLGGKPYRDGSYEYYLSEAVVTNDPKGIGPFIMACVEIFRVS